jgi:hypothetical protein
MLDKSIDGALLALRKQIIRGNGEGLAQVEALCRMRGVDLPAVLPAKRADAARKGLMRAIILDGIRKGCCTQRGLAEYVASQRPEISQCAAYVRTTQALQKLRRAGVVRCKAGERLAKSPALDHMTCYRRVDRAIGKLHTKGYPRQCCKGVWGPV